jgi:hypothetical protein
MKKSLQNSLKFSKQQKKTEIFQKNLKICSHSSIGKHLKTSKTTKESACYTQYWLVIKKKVLHN